MFSEYSEAVLSISLCARSETAFGWEISWRSIRSLNRTACRYSWCIFTLSLELSPATSGNPCNQLEMVRPGPNKTETPIKTARHIINSGNYVQEGKDRTDAHDYRNPGTHLPGDIRVPGSEQRLSRIGRDRTEPNPRGINQSGRETLPGLSSMIGSGWK